MLCYEDEIMEGDPELPGRGTGADTGALCSKAFTIPCILHIPLGVQDKQEKYPKWKHKNLAISGCDITIRRILSSYLETQYFDEYPQ